MGKWEIVMLGDVIKVTSGGTPKKDIKEYYENGVIPWVKTGDLKSKYIIQTEDSITESALQNSSAKLFPVGTVLVAMYGATIGACSILSIEASTNQACAALLPTEKFLSLYLYYYFKSIREQLVALGVGGAQPNISGSIIKNIQIPLPPLPIQQKIADILDRASTLIEKRKAQIEKLDLLVKSRFAEMFGDPVTNPMGWKVGTIRDLVSDVKYGTSKPAEEDGEYIYLRMNNITFNGNMDFTDLKYINVDERDYEKYVARKGDLLFNRTNSRELVGKTAVFTEDTPMIIAGYIIRVRTNERANPEYISAFLNSQYGKKTLYGMCKAIIGQANINAQELQDIAIMLPPLALQNQFAMFVSAVEEKKLFMRRSLTKYDFMYKSLMQKCFEGDFA